jgi:hypothetical protein
MMKQASLLGANITIAFLSGVQGNKGSVFIHTRDSSA